MTLTLKHMYELCIFSLFVACYITCKFRVAEL